MCFSCIFVCNVVAIFQDDILKAQEQYKRNHTQTQSSRDTGTATASSFASDSQASSAAWRHGFHSVYDVCWYVWCRFSIIGRCIEIMSIFDKVFQHSGVRLLSCLPCYFCGFCISCLVIVFASIDWIAQSWCLRNPNSEDWLLTI